MKKVLKRIALVFAILIFLVLSVIGIALWFVFTPERLTPLVRKQAAQYLTCKSEIGSVELTFFSTFPQFGLKVNNFELINPIPNAQSDTLVVVEELIGVVDVGAYWKREDIVLNELIVKNGVINGFIDSLGNTNFDITIPDTVASADTSQTQPFKLDVKRVILDNISLSYIDNQSKMLAEVGGIFAQISATMDSVNLESNINVSNSLVTFVFDGEKYLNKANISLKIPSKMNLSKSLMAFGNSEFSINGIELFFSGTVEDDTLNKRINTNVAYRTSEFSVPTLIALIPPAFQSYVEGMTLEGVAASDGKITGSYSASGMPLMDIHIAYKDGSIVYSALPWPLTNAQGDFVFYSDLTNDDITYFRINKFRANTPKSSFSTSGLINHLFSDIYMDLTTETAGFNLVEAKPFIPANMNIKILGVVDGKVRTAFSMSQIDKMLIDRMKISGAVNLSNFDVLYDSIFMKTDKSTVDFALPNPNKQNKFSPFLFTKIQTKNLEAGTLDGYKANITNGTIALETSDVMDSTRLPDVTCNFDLEALAAIADTIKVEIAKPSGKFVMLSKNGPNKQDEITLNYSNLGFNAKAGSSAVSLNKTQLYTNVVNYLKEPKIKFECDAENLSAAMDGNSIDLGKFKVNTSIVNDLSQKDSLLQWVPKGSLSLNRGVIKSSMINSVVEIPSIKMDFSPEQFDIMEGRVKIDSSDFSLSGTLTNMLSYYKGDSLLKGNFNFVSKQTDVLQLMSLTSGIGAEESDSTANAPADTAATGPYMVPKGIDITLKTDINRALFGTEIAKDISGEVRVKDGILVLNNLIFTTPASKMQLTAMYKTPRKNHIYAGFDYHMLNIQIEDLLKMVPDIDSIMPMLKSFKGTGEFHFAAETYLDSMYNPKKSTIRGIGSIKGNDLVLMDGETFTEIAKTMRFTKKAENKVDSLSAEFTVFTEEIDIYPFMIVMDRYKAVVAGRHNMDMSFDYNISLIESPLPLKICVDVSGTMDNLKYKPVKCKYDDLYRPASRMLLQNKQMELRRIIRESLVKKVVVE